MTVALSPDLARAAGARTLAPGTAPVAVVGGGIMGISVAYFLARRGVACDVFEASPVLGGLAGPLMLPDGVAIDRFYHAILSSDDHLRTLCEELGIASQLRFRETRTAVYIDGGLHTMNSLAELLTFPPLSPIARFRLGLTIARAQLYRDYRRLETIDVRDWLRRLGGRQLLDRLWGPMLAAKFDGDPQGIPATWMWSRLVRMKSTRNGANQREQAGHLIGGYATLLTAMAARIKAAGGTIHLNTPISQVLLDDRDDRSDRDDRADRVDRGNRGDRDDRGDREDRYHRDDRDDRGDRGDREDWDHRDVRGDRNDRGNRGVSGVEIRGQRRAYRSVVMTMQGPIASKLLPTASPAYRAQLEQLPYLGIVCPLLVLDRPLSGTWTINVADRRIPFTGVIETTSYIDPALVGGHHLVYVPKYTAPGSRWFSASDEEIRRAWIDGLSRIVPGFSESWIRYFLIHRERFVDPLHRIGTPETLPRLETPVRGLYLATTAQIYPALTNGESVTRHAALAASAVLAEVGR